MAPTTVPTEGPAKDDRPSGVPGPHELGASRKEAWWALGALLVFVLIAASFWFQASH